MKMLKEFFIGFKSGQKSFGETLGIILNSILLTLVYFIGVGLTFLFMRILKKRLLEKKINGSKSYWTNLKLTKQPMANYFRQF